MEKYKNNPLVLGVFIIDLSIVLFAMLINPIIREHGSSQHLTQFKQWHYQWESTFQQQIPQSDAKWLSTAQPYFATQPASTKGLWIKTKLPATKENQTLYLYNVFESFQMYIDGKKHYSFGWSEHPPPWSYPGFSSHLIPINSHPYERELVIHIVSQQSRIGLFLWHYMGSNQDVLLHLFTQDLLWLIISALNIVIAIILLCFALIYKNRSGLALSGMALSSAVTIFSRTDIIYFFMDYPHFWDNIFIISGHFTLLFSYIYFLTIFPIDYKAKIKVNIIVELMSIIISCCYLYIEPRAMRIMLQPMQLVHFILTIRVLYILYFVRKYIPTKSILILISIAFSMILVIQEVLKSAGVFNGLDMFIRWTSVIDFVFIIALLIQHFTEVQEEKQSAKKISQFKSQFLAQMSHELRTPLHAVLGHLQLLQESMNHSHLEAAQQSAKNLHVLIDELFSLTKMESGKLQLDLQTLDCSILIKELEQLIQPQLEEKKLTWVLNIASPIPLVQTDVNRLRQVLLNLLTNAIKYTKHGFVKLNISYEEQPEQLTTLNFEVLDSGIGISSKDQQQIFKAYKQLNSNSEGAGLGLALTQTLTQELGGYLDVESHLNKGSRFRVILPNLPSVTPSDFKPIKKSLIQTSTKLLLVDDIAVHRNILREFLEPRGVVCIEASNSQEALSQIHRHSPELVILDLNLGEENGLLLAQDIKNINPNIPCMLISASAWDITSEGMQPISTVLSKPIDFQQLLEELNKHLPQKMIELPQVNQSENDPLLIQWKNLIQLPNIEALNQFSTLLSTHLTQPAKELAEGLKSNDLLQVQKTLKNLSAFFQTPVYPLIYQSNTELIMVVEDDLSSLQFAYSSLKNEGYSVLACQEAKEALSLAAAYQPKLILLDVQMPHINGWELCKQIKAQSSTQDIPILFLTGQREVADLLKGFEVGGIDYLSKPFFKEELLARVNAHIQLQLTQIELRQNIEELALVTQDKDFLLQLVSHDLKNPLSVMVGYIQLLQSTQLKSYNIQEYSGIINELCQRLQHIINNILSMYALEEGHLSPQFQEASLTTLIEDNLAYYRLLANHKGIQLEFSPSKPPLTISTDPQLFAQLLGNLLTNAIKYSPYKSNVYIYSVSEKNKIKIGIQDAGPGLSQAEQGLIFKKYATLNDKNIGGEQSHGLGLYLVKRLAQSLQIEIELESEVGKGCLFWLIFPRQENSQINQSSQENYNSV